MDWLCIGTTSCNSLWDSTSHVKVFIITIVWFLYMVFSLLIEGYGEKCCKQTVGYQASHVVQHAAPKNAQSQNTHRSDSLKPPWFLVLHLARTQYISQVGYWTCLSSEGATICKRIHGRNPIQTLDCLICRGSAHRDPYLVGQIRMWQTAVFFSHGIQLKKCWKSNLFNHFLIMDFQFQWQAVCGRMSHGFWRQTSTMCTIP